MSVAAIGVDAGSTTTKLVAVDAVGTQLWHLLEDTDPRMELQTGR
jgi:activator of 2-hydroxyglutaryl-CoA dehydratase